MNNRVFIDTNILLRANHSSMRFHEEIDNALKQLRIQGTEFWISRQIIREYLVQVTRDDFSPLGRLAITDVLQNLQSAVIRFQIADDTAAVTEKLYDLLKQYPTGGKQIHDANIVATMLVNHIERLITLNVEDMKRYPIQLISPMNLTGGAA